MQTFLPYPDYDKSAACLDDKRLGKQRVECVQILQALVDGPYQCFNCYTPRNKDTKPCVKCGKHMVRRTPWYNHPATQLWKGYEHSLYHIYMGHIVSEWLRRGFKDTCYLKATLILRQKESIFWQPFNQPPVIGNPEFHAAHRSNLLRKNYEHYKQFGWTEPINLPYIWKL